MSHLNLLQDIRQSLADLVITRVEVEGGDGRVRPGAKLHLARSALLETWPASRSSVFVKNKEARVCVGSSEGWLCVARLPPDTDTAAFLALAGRYGVVSSGLLVCR